MNVASLQGHGGTMVLHEVVFVKVGVAVLVANHIFLIHQVIVSMVFLPSKILPPLSFISILGLLFFPLHSFRLAFLALVHFSLGSEIGEFLNLGFVETVHGWVLPSRDVNLPDRFLIMKGDLTSCH